MAALESIDHTVDRKLHLGDYVRSRPIVRQRKYAGLPFAEMRYSPSNLSLSDRRHMLQVGPKNALGYRIQCTTILINIPTDRGTNGVNFNR